MKIPTASSTQSSAKTITIAIPAKTLLDLVLKFTRAREKAVEALKSIAPATMKSLIFQFTSDVKCIATNGTSNKNKEDKPILIAVLVCFIAQSFFVNRIYDLLIV